VAGFDGGAITSDAGALLLGVADRAIGLVGRFAQCFRDVRRPELIEHEVKTLLGQRVFGIALGYEDLNDHDDLRHDPVMAVLAGKLRAKRKDCAPVAGKSTLNRLELSRPEATRYHKISYEAGGIEALFVTLFLESFREAPEEIVLDWTRPTTRCTATRKAVFSTATTIAIAICRSTSSAATSFWQRSCGRPTLMARLVQWRKWPASSPKCASAGRWYVSYCAPIQALRATV
jgi:hypothetical protein